jgi:hypothetical protein
MFPARLQLLTQPVLTFLLVGAGGGLSAARSAADEPPAAREPGGHRLPTYKQDVSRLSEGAAKRYAAIKPRPEEVKWRQIPWLTDLNKAIQVAKEEKRPLLMWTGQQSHPLERC